MSVAVVGGGATGLFVAGLLARKGEAVTVFEKNEKAGKKLFITGKGRCNLTNLCSVDDFLKNVVRGEKFLRTAIYNFTPNDCVQMFESLGLRTKVERGNRVFPESDFSGDVIDALKKVLCKNVKFCFNHEILQISKLEQTFVLKTKSQEFEFDKVIVATGGKSYSATGSSGDGYKFARAFSHNVIEPVPALCPILIKDKFIKSVEGVSLKNVSLNVEFDGKKKSFFGEMIFTDKGISGPIVLTASSYVNRAKNVKISLDFKPALDEKTLDARLVREFDANKNKNLSTVLKNLLPNALIDPFVEKIGLQGDLKINSINRADRQKILSGLKNFELKFGGLYPIESAIITSGGVDISQVNPKTFESKIVSGLYFLGEVLDVDALTGGFNLQIAWATAFCLAKNFTA